ncbi:MAG: bifunctional o-acetylhomoserine/o-acetylserine sulfhydrylase [Actinobacteria bacterium]|nr:bifunctional o-acetylhomoserine/o-acetylserine sulfhydrylase [Actinomycetota bacterium]
MSNNWSFETRQIHAGQSPDSQTNARALPIYQTTAYTFRDTKHAADLFALAEPGNIYTRIMNPTQGAVEERVASLEGGVAALLLASGQAAETYAILNLAEAGDHIVSSPNLYGGTYNLFHYTLPRYGIEVTFVDDPDDLDSWKKAIRPNTKAFFGESIANPSNAILDIENIAKIAHENGIPLIVDNTVATPFLLRPIEFGADIVVHSATKYMGGHGTTVAGVIVDSGKFDWKKNAAKFPQYNTPDPSYGGLVYADALGELAYILRARIVLLRDFGAAVSPFNAFLIAQGLETLSLRMERHIQKVNYASLDSHPHNKWAKKYTPAGSGAVLSFEIKGGIEAGKKFVEALELHSHVANIGDVRSLVIHPASTTHSQLTPQEQLDAGVTPGLIRLAVGIENINDILADIEIGFNAAKGA